MYGEITTIEQLNGFKLGNNAPMTGKNGAQLGMMSMLNTLGGGRSMDGYKVTTKDHAFLVLIDNGQSCCESWGYMASEDKLDDFIGADLREVTLTDTALNTMKMDDVYIGDGGIQFVNFETSRGTLQLAVYNGHNGYYGHGIIVAIDDKIICDNTL